MAIGMKNGCQPHGVAGIWLTNIAVTNKTRCDENIPVCVNPWMCNYFLRLTRESTNCL